MEKDARIKCVKSIGSFVEGNEYKADRRSFINKEVANDVQVMVIESQEGDMLNCYLMPVDKVYEHFSMIEEDKK